MQTNKSGLAGEMIDLEKQLTARLSSLRGNSREPKWNPDGVEFIYSPLEYAFNLHNQYLKMYCDSPRRIMFLGMNPGPFGMVQTGAKDQKLLNHICDDFLYKTLNLYKVEIILAIGRYAEKRSSQVLKDNNISHVKVVYIPHPSLQNRKTANNWPEIVKHILTKEDLIQYLQNN